MTASLRCHSRSEDRRETSDSDSRTLTSSATTSSATICTLKILDLGLALLLGDQPAVELTRCPVCCLSVLSGELLSCLIRSRSTTSRWILLRNGKSHEAARMPSAHLVDISETTSVEVFREVIFPCSLRGRFNVTDECTAAGLHHAGI